MRPHEERVLAEKKELDEKLEKLRSFIFDPNPIFEKLPLYDRNLLEDQFTRMLQYSEILERRIARFSK